MCMHYVGLFKMYSMHYFNYENTIIKALVLQD